MTTYVYILSDYGEYGAENVCATLDRSLLEQMLRTNWPVPTEIDEGAPIPDWRQREHSDWIGAALKGLKEAMLLSDEELAKQGGWYCNLGWGGVMLHVVPLVGQSPTETLLIAWRDARKAIFAHDVGKDTPKLFDKLATAERLLMEHARALGPTRLCTAVPTASSEVDALNHDADSLTQSPSLDSPP